MTVKQQLSQSSCNFHIIFQSMYDCSTKMILMNNDIFMLSGAQNFSDDLCRIIINMVTTTKRICGGAFEWREQKARDKREPWKRKEGYRRFAKTGHRQKAKGILWIVNDIFICVVRLPIVKMSSPHGDS